jgi:hypothetical protein
VPARVADALLALRGSERVATEAAKEAGKRVAALLLRCDGLEGQAAELRVALHACVPTATSRAENQGPPAGGALLLDPGAARELGRLRSALEAANEAAKAKDEEIAALAFSKESKQGRMLMARVRTLIKENEEFGAQVSEGKVHGLETQVAMLKAHVSKLKQEHGEMAAMASALAAENESLQLRALGGRGGDGGGGGAAPPGRSDDGAVEGQGGEAWPADVAMEAEAAEAPGAAIPDKQPEVVEEPRQPAKRTRAARK